MAYTVVRKAYATTKRSLFVPHTPLQPDRWTGVLHLLWTIEQAHPVVIGAGWFGLRSSAVQPAQRLDLGPRRRPTTQKPPSSPEVVAEIVRRGPDAVPVLPGSSIKGAVRQVYELLTSSCSLERGAACRVRPKDSEPEVCPACSLFGAAGLGGRLAFGEAEPVSAQSRPQLVVSKVPTAWQPRKAEDGTIKVYDQEKLLGPDGRGADAKELTWGVFGTLRSSVRLTNASEEELGLLFASLGFGATSPMVRLGGKKFHGFGAADVSLEGAHWRYPTAKRWAGESGRADSDLEKWACALVNQWVLEKAERKRAWDNLHVALLRARSSGQGQ